MDRIGVLALLLVLSSSTAAFARVVNEVHQVPEPSSLAVMGVAGLLMLSRHLRRRSAANRSKHMGGTNEN
jgi:hypothetical protein